MLIDTKSKDVIASAHTRETNDTQGIDAKVIQNENATDKRFMNVISEKFDRSFHKKMLLFSTGLVNSPIMTPCSMSLANEFEKVSAIRRQRTIGLKDPCADSAASRTESEGNDGAAFAGELKTKSENAIPK